MINNIQLVLHLPLFNLPMPANLILFMQALFDVITFDFFNTEYFSSLIFGLEDTDNYPPYNDNFDFIGYSTNNFLYNMGT